MKWYETLKTVIETANYAMLDAESFLYSISRDLQKKFVFRGTWKYKFALNKPLKDSRYSHASIFQIGWQGLGNTKIA